MREQPEERFDGRMRPARLRLRWVVSALLPALAGCVDPRPPGEGSRLIPSGTPYLRDIPLPQGFRLADKSSEEWASGPIRFVRHRYEGGAGAKELYEFYRSEMPLVRWSPVEENLLHGRRRLRFQREGEVCDVMIEARSQGFSRKVVAEVTIAPRASRALPIGQD